MKYTDEHLPLVVEAYEKAGGNKAEGARLLDLPVTTFKWLYRKAERKNLTGNVLGGPALDGFHISKVTTHNGPDGEITQWRHEVPDALDLDEFMESCREVLSAVEPLPVVRLNKATMPNLLAVYPIVDHHLGMFSWAKETGQAYDLEIAERVLLGTLTKLVQKAPRAETALLLGLGDFFHMDSAMNRTERSGNVLDVDTRYPKVLQMGIKLWKTAVQLCLQKHENVLVRVLRGNHDDRGALILAIALSEAFANNPRVTVDVDPSLMFFME